MADFVDKAGPLIYPLFLLSVLAGTVVIERLFALRRSRVIPREIVEVETPYGKDRVKRAERGSAGSTVQPEFDDCRRLAAEAGVSVEEVRRAALLAAGDRRKE